MLKQLFGKLPRKSSKSDHPESPRSHSKHSPSSSPRSNSAPSGHGTRRPSAGTSASGRLSTVKKASAAVFPASVVAGIEPLVPFKDVPGAEKMNLFVSKLSLCCVTFDFSDINKNSAEKDVKRKTLLELVDFIASGSIRFSEPAIHAMCKMCAFNLFRIFPPNYRSAMGVDEGENDDDDPTLDPAWPHLQIVYDLLLKFIHSSGVDAKVAKKYIDHNFILKLLDLFDSEDPRERESLKTVLHRIYGKFMVHRPFIRKSMNNIFFRFIFETERHNGMAELLEIFGSIVSGFALPLKEEHKIFLWRILIPLHKPKSVGVYFQQLSYCISQFLEKDPKLASVVITGLLKYWPITNSQKEVMFLGELEEILEATSLQEFQKVAAPISIRIAYCINSFHFQVAERALFLWNNDHIVNLMGHNRDLILPIILPALEKNAQSHWNQAVLNLSLNVRKMFMEMDEELFISCQLRLKDQESKESSAAEERKQVWKLVESAANLQPVVERTAVLVTP